LRDVRNKRLDEFELPGVCQTHTSGYLPNLFPTVSTHHFICSFTLTAVLSRIVRPLSMSGQAKWAANRSGQYVSTIRWPSMPPLSFIDSVAELKKQLLLSFIK
jgi:hypothetical protein